MLRYTRTHTTTSKQNFLNLETSVLKNSQNTRELKTTHIGIREHNIQPETAPGTSKKNLQETALYKSRVWSRVIWPTFHVQKVLYFYFECFSIDQNAFSKYFRILILPGNLGKLRNRGGIAEEPRAVAYRYSDEIWIHRLCIVLCVL